MKREILHPEVERYLQGLCPEAPQVVHAMEELARERDFPIVGRQVGRLLELFARSIGARRVIDLGSGFGYSAYWFARAVGAGGTVFQSDRSASNAAKARGFLDKAGLSKRTRFEVGDALEILAAKTGKFDLIFCDIDKEQYPQVPDMAVPLLRQGGLLIFDNSLWFGRVADVEAGEDSTRAVQRVNRELFARTDMLTTLVPLRDGLLVSMKL